VALIAVVDLASVTNVNNKNYYFPVVDLRDDAIVPHPIPPDIPETPAQRLARRA
jgi:hypothetical protein